MMYPKRHYAAAAMFVLGFQPSQHREFKASAFDWLDTTSPSYPFQSPSWISPLFISGVG